MLVKLITLHKAVNHSYKSPILLDSIDITATINVSGSVLIKPTGSQKRSAKT